jgi:hypothetical protein
MPGQRQSKKKAWIAMSSAMTFFPNFKGLSYKRQALPARVATLSQHLFYESQPGLEGPASIHEWISLNRQSGRGHLGPKTSAARGEVYVDTSCPLRANTGRSPTAWRTGQIDPFLPSAQRPLRGRLARAKAATDALFLSTRKGAVGEFPERDNRGGPASLWPAKRRDAFPRVQRRRSRSSMSRNPPVLGVNTTWRRSSDSNPLSHVTP